MKKQFWALGMIVVMAVMMIAAGNPGEEVKTTGIKWMTWEEAQAAQAKEPRKIFVDVYTHWCGWCKRMDQTTFKDPKIVQYLNDNFYNVKFNAEVQDSIMFKGQYYQYVPNGRRGYNELAALLMNGRLSYPTTVYLDENLDLLATLPGYKKTQELDMILHFLGEDLYKEMEWADFQKQYQTN